MQRVAARTTRNATGTVARDRAILNSLGVGVPARPNPVIEPALVARSRPYWLEGASMGDLQAQVDRTLPSLSRPTDHNSTSWLGVSPVDAQFAAERRAIESQRDPNTAKVAELDALDRYLEGRAKLEASHPYPSLPGYTPPATIARTNPAFPGPAPMPTDQGSDILAALASVFAPQGAGMFGSAVARQMSDARDRQDDWNLRQFSYDRDVADQQFQDANANRAEQIRIALQNRAEELDRQKAQRESDLQAGLLPLEQAKNKTIRGALVADTEGFRKQQLAELLASQAGERVKRNESTYNKEFDRFLKNEAERNDLMRSLIATQGSYEGTQFRQSAQDARNAVNNEQRMLRLETMLPYVAGRGGFMPGPNGPVPMPENQLPVATRANIEQSRAAAAASKANVAAKKGPAKVTLDNLNSVRTQYNNAYIARTKWFDDYKKAHPGMTAKQIFQIPEYKGFEAREKRAKETMDDVEARYNAQQAGQRPGGKKGDPLGIL